MIERPALGCGDALQLACNRHPPEAERRCARAILDRCEGSQSAAASQLGISRNKLAASHGVTLPGVVVGRVYSNGATST